MAHDDNLYDCYKPPAQEFVRGEGAYLYNIWTSLPVFQSIALAMLIPFPITPSESKPIKSGIFQACSN